jgi:4-methyl-5(b-hydroxyethyl)-thiazole monophosphate biosynthesis
MTFTFWTYTQSCQRTEPISNSLSFLPISYTARQIMADATIEEAAKDADKWDLIVLPGGMPGAEHLRDSAPLVELLKKQQAASKLYGAVCASPAVALVPHGLAKDGCTCYPAEGFRSMIGSPSDDDVVIQDNFLTSQGPGTSLKFALQLGETLYGKEAADNIAKAMLVTR